MVYHVEATAMFANAGKNSKGYQSHGYHGQVQGYHGHQGQRQGYHGGKGGNSKKERPICIYCGLIGHIVDKCYKLHGYPSGYKPRGSNRPTNNQVSAILPSSNFGNSDLSNGGFFSNGDRKSVV